MKTFKVLGSGCSNCLQTAKLIESTAKKQAINVRVEKITDLEVIMGYGVMSTPAVVCDEKVIHSGGIPKADTILSWLGE